MVLLNLFNIETKMCFVVGLMFDIFHIAIRLPLFVVVLLTNNKQDSYPPKIQETKADI